MGGLQHVSEAHHAATPESMLALKACMQRAGETIAKHGDTISKQHKTNPHGRRAKMQSLVARQRSGCALQISKGCLGHGPAVVHGNNPFLISHAEIYNNALPKLHCHA